MKQTNDTTNQILKFFYSNQIFAWRQNVTGIPLKSGGFRPTSKKGVSDIIAILPPHGQFLGVEIKTGPDRIRPEQEGFKQNVEQMGGIYLLVTDFADFINQWNHAASLNKIP